MKIQSNKLVTETGDKPVSFVNSPNQGGVITPKFLIIHYTAGRSAKSSIEWFMNPQAQASAHLVIGPDGSITQLVPFNKKAFHAGKSKWAGLDGLNSHSIGIELDNPGKLKKTGSKWLAWFGAEYPENKVLIATHKHQQEPAGWHIYTEAQIEACIKVSQVIVKHYNLLEILGHDDISPLRKEDPGPAFPMESFKSKVLGRENDTEELFKVNTAGTNFRTGPGTGFASMGKLSKGVKVEFVESNMGWFHVVLAQRVTGITEPEGWVHSSLLTKI